MKPATLRLIVASIIAPGLPALSTFGVVWYWNIQLPDNFGAQVFLFYAACFYIAAMPAFWLAYATRKSLITYSIVGMFITCPLWMLTMSFPSDASVNPLNPQFFHAPSTMLLGLLSGFLFFCIAGNRQENTSYLR